MSTRDIRTFGSEASCDVCGRTLLRGERAEVYLNGGARRSVCELCKAHVIHEGWVREGTVPAYEDERPASDRRRSLLGRLRARREASSTVGGGSPREQENDGGPLSGGGAVLGGVVGKGPDRVREPRHVRAVPTSVEHRVASAVDVFNSSEHRRTVAGVGRSLGAPTVAVIASEAYPSRVNVTVSWELCWYRYEVELSDDQPNVRVAGQGDELGELELEERQPNAVCDVHGSLVLA